jgi:hypothetical protein
MSWQDIDIMSSLMMRMNGEAENNLVPQVDSHLLDLATSIYNRTETPASKANMFQLYAKPSQVEKASQLEKALMDGTLAYEGGIGHGFQSYDQYELHRVYNDFINELGYF